MVAAVAKRGTESRAMIEAGFSGLSSATCLQLDARFLSLLARLGNLEYGFERRAS